MGSSGLEKSNSGKKWKWIILGVICAIIGGCLLAIYLGYFSKSRESEDKAKALLDDLIDGEDDEYVHVTRDFMKTLQEAFSNEDVVAYIDYENAGISYPVVKSEDNEEYLHMDLEGNYSPFGTLFLDMVDKEDFSDTNSVIYGHHMIDGSMFGGLERYIDGLDEFGNDTIYIYTREGRKEYKVVCDEVIINTQENAERLTISARKDFLDWLNEISIHNVYNDEEGNFLTLITCHYSGARVDRYGLTSVFIEEKPYKVKGREE